MAEGNLPILRSRLQLVIAGTSDFGRKRGGRRCAICITDAVVGGFVKAQLFGEQPS